MTSKSVISSRSQFDAGAKSWELGTAVALSSVVLTGCVSAWLIPNGPITTAHVWLVMLASLVTGLVAGWGLRSPWAMLLAPLVYVLCFELVRPSGAVPTTGALRLDNSYGILALLVGRGFHGLVALLPLMLGAGLGVFFTRSSSDHTWLKAAPLLILAVLVTGLAIWNGIPAHTPPIVGADGQPVPGSIAELTAVSLGGQEQTIMIRAHSADRPVLLYLSGGPGQSDLPYSRVLLEDLTQDFIVVSWDQRGTGKSYPALHPTSAVTLEQAVADTIELTNYLRQRFAEEKIYLLWVNLGAPRWACWRCSSGPIFTTPGLAAGKW